MWPPATAQGFKEGMIQSRSEDLSLRSNLRGSTPPPPHKCGTTHLEEEGIQHVPLKVVLAVVTVCHTHTCESVTSVHACTVHQRAKCTLIITACPSPKP